MGDMKQRLLELAGRGGSFGLLDRIVFRDIQFGGLVLRVLGIHFMDCKADWQAKTHKHSFFEFHYVLKQDTLTVLNGTEHRICEGSFYLMPPGTFHSHRHDNEEGHIGFALRWELAKDGAENTAKCEYREIKEIIDLFRDIPLVVIKDDGTVLDNMLSLLEKAEKGLPALCLKLDLFRLITGIAVMYSASSKNVGMDVNRGFIDNNIANTAMRFIEENYSQDIDVKDVADSVHISYSHLSRLFKTYVGESVNQHLNRIRIKNAQYLLKCTRKEVAQIAEETGFQSEKYFCDVFKKATGVSPRIYRKTDSKLTAQ